MRYKHWLTYALLGVALGAATAFVKPKQHEARITIYFPAVQSTLFLNLVHALQAEPQSMDSRNLASSELDIGPVARLIFESEAAWKSARQKCLEEGLTGQPSAVLEVTNPAACTLELRVRTRSAEYANRMLQSLLDYYLEFVKKTPLTRVNATKSDVDSQLSEVRRQLSKLEEELSRSKSAELRALGEATLKVNPKLLTQVWLRRADETRQTEELLSRLRKLRGKARDPQSDQDLRWLNQWAAARGSELKSSKVNQLLSTPVSRRELLARIKLERTYSEALMRHRALVLQQSFLSTWQNLESFNFEVISPVSVSTVSPGLAFHLGLGATGGILLGLVTKSGGRKQIRG